VNSFLSGGFSNKLSVNIQGLSLTSRELLTSQEERFSMDLAKYSS
jgi:hypothetical protein